MCQQSFSFLFHRIGCELKQSNQFGLFEEIFTRVNGKTEAEHEIAFFTFQKLRTQNDDHFATTENKNKKYFENCRQFVSNCLEIINAFIAKYYKAFTNK